MLIMLVSCGNNTSDVVSEISESPEIVQNTVETEVIIPEDIIEIWEEESVEVDEFADWGWEYYDDENNVVVLYGPAEDGAVDFEIWYANECTGFAGTAYLERSGVANYYDDANSCQMNLTYNPGSIELTTYDCQEYVDVGCNDFSDTYNIQ